MVGCIHVEACPYCCVYTVPYFQIFLPFMKKKTELQKPSDGETLKSHWLVDDMYTFENVGFSNTVNGIKYLICADCEIGPVGWHSTDAKNEFYIALDRVLQEQ